MLPTPLTSIELFFILGCIRLQDVPPGTGHGDEAEDPILATIIDVAAFNDAWAEVADIAMLGHGMMLKRRVSEWLSEQTPAALNQRRKAVIERVRAEDPNRRYSQGFDYQAEYLRVLNGCGVFLRRIEMAGPDQELEEGRPGI